MVRLKSRKAGWMEEKFDTIKYLYYDNGAIRTKQIREFDVGDLILYGIPKSKHKDFKLLRIDFDKYKKVVGNRIYEYKELPFEIKICNDFLFFIGWYIAEGSTGGRNKKDSRNVSFTLHIDEIHIAERLNKISKSIFGLSGKISKRPKNKRCDLVISNALLARFLDEFCGKGAVNKQIPDVLYEQCSDRQLDILLEAYLSGDGYVKTAKKVKSRMCSIGTISEKLSNQIFNLLLRLGYIPNKRTKEANTDSTGTNHKKSYYVEWNGSRTDMKSKDYFIFDNYLCCRVLEKNTE